jgi:hypothetical protein
VTCRALSHAAAVRGDASAASRWLKRAEHSARRRASAREAALNQVLAAQLQWQQGQAEGARRDMTAAAAALRSLGMDWHAQRAEAQLAGLAAHPAA